MKWCFSLSIGALVTILTGALVATTVTSEIGYGFLGTEIDDKISGNLALGKTCAYVVTIGTEAIIDDKSILSCAASIGDGIAGSFGS